MTEAVEKTIIAGDDAVLARRYAGALYDLASEQKQLDAVAGDLRGLKQLLRESAEFRAIAAHPRLSRDQLVAMVKQVADIAKLNKLTANFLALTARNRRLASLDGIINAFLAELASRRGEYTAEVSTAQALSPAQQEQLATKLSAWAGGKVHLAMHKDVSLLGGIVVKMGSRLIDASVRTRLNQLERQLKSKQTTQKGAA